VTAGARFRGNRPGKSGPERLGDFDVDGRFVLLAGLALPIGVAGAFLALALLRLIGLFTNLFFFGRWSTDLVSPAAATPGPLIVAIPVLGGLAVGLMARYGSERIRGHGIPEAIEAILINRSRVDPKVAVLKPLSSAISIGSGGPFGAEGPIIMTGGAVGSLVGQLLHLTSQERKTLLVGGAAAGMAATFDAPIAATLLAVELLLFEWRPRSMIPVAAAAITAAVVRHFLLGAGPLFPVPPHPAFVGVAPLIACLGVGIAAGVLSAALTQGVYLWEDLFGRLPIHWMWWPALGGIAIGLGGLVFPHALGVGYDTLGQLLDGRVAVGTIAGVLVVKALIWMIALGSGTSGGVLAPLLMMGAALGGLEARVLPDLGIGFWPLVSMGAILGGTMRVPFTALVFTLELTHDLPMLLPVMIAVTTAYGFTVLVMRRSILTEKLSRRGHHLSREYTVDPLEGVFVEQVMRTSVTVLPADMPPDEVRAALADTPGARGQGLYPVTDAGGRMLGVVTLADVEVAARDRTGLLDQLRPDPVVAYADEPVRAVAERMAETGFTRLPVVDRDGEDRLVSVVSLSDLLQARLRVLEEERERERTLRIRRLRPIRRGSGVASAPTAPDTD
jgi:CIC family chloride channel protein